jgi:hypothetical protein
MRVRGVAEEKREVLRPNDLIDQTGDTGEKEKR